MGQDYEYRTLDINKDGVGAYHANRYGIIFYPRLGETLDSIEKDFKNQYESYFNGYGTSVSDNKSLPAGIKNIADVRLTNEKRGEQGVYAFLLHNPGVHFDFVCEVSNYKKNYAENEAPGFAFETLKRIGKSLARTINRLNPITWPQEKVNELNDAHVLAGRRSWSIFKCTAIQKKDIVFLSGSSQGRQKRHKPFAPNEACFIQTAAIERYSSAFSAAAGRMVDDRAVVDRIWSNQLINFVKMNNYKFWSRSLKVFRDRPSELSWSEDGKANAGVLDTVFINKKSFAPEQKKSMYGDELVNSILTAHPALKEQFPDWK